MRQESLIALAGNPNCGKTTLFNAITGAHHHVGNYPGVTVEKKVGAYQRNGHKLSLVDLPGVYSLTAYSLDERVAREFLVSNRPAVVINIVDASNLERNLYLTVQLLELGIPTVIALNMVDEAEARGIEIDAEELGRRLEIPVVPTVARTGKGTDELARTPAATAEEEQPWQPLRLSYGLGARCHRRRHSNRRTSCMLLSSALDRAQNTGRRSSRTGGALSAKQRAVQPAHPTGRQADNASQVDAEHLP